jgi:branched-chain amino acid transport system ATP-binding protein
MRSLPTSRCARSIWAGGGMTEAAPVLALDRITAGHGDTVVLEALDLSLGAGESLSVLGRNGVGKTTLIDTVMGHTRVRAGSIRFAGRDIVHWPPWRRSRAGLGYVPQEREIFPSLTVREHLQIAARPGPWTIERAFATFPGLAERRRHRGDALSGGEQQMLAIARALVGNPNLLLMDEPTEGLAPIVVERLAATIRELGRDQGMAIVLVEQHAELALEFAARSIVMDRGQIVYDGPSAALAGDRQRLQRLVGVAR